MSQTPLAPGTLEEPLPPGTVWRRLWDEAGTVVLREGPVPAETPNNREALTSYWLRQDREAAAAAVAELLEEEEDQGVDLEAMERKLEATTLQLRTVSQRLADLEQQRLVDPDQAVLLAADLARAQLAPQTIVGALDQATASLEGTAAEARERLAELEGQVAAAEQRLEQLRQDTAEALANAIARQEAEAARDRLQALEMLSARASELQGPPGDQGPASPGIAAAPGKPSAKVLERELGRPPIAGDLFLQLGGPEEDYLWRFDGQTFEQGPIIGTTVVKAVSVVASSNQSVTFDPTGKPPENSGGAEAFAPLVVPVGAGPVRLWDSSRWAAGNPQQEVHSALLYLEAISTADGSRGSCLVNITEKDTGGAFEFTVYAELGLFGDQIEPEVTAALQPATPRPGATLPAGLPQSLVVSVSLIGPNGSSYAINGWIQPALQAGPDGKQPQPGW